MWFHLPDTVDDVFSVANLINFLDDVSNVTQARVDISVDDLYLATLGGQPFPVAEHVRDWTGFVLDLERVLTHFDLPSKLRITVQAAWAYREQVNLMKMLLAGAPKSLHITGTLDDPPALPTRFHYPIVSSFPFGTHRCLVSAALVGPAHVAAGHDNRFQIEPDAVELVRKQLLIVDEPAPKSVRELLAEVADRFSDRDDVLVWWQADGTSV